MSQAVNGDRIRETVPQRPQLSVPQRVGGIDGTGDNGIIRNPSFPVPLRVASAPSVTSSSNGLSQRPQFPVSPSPVRLPPQPIVASSSRPSPIIRTPPPVLRPATVAPPPVPTTTTPALRSPVGLKPPGIIASLFQQQIDNIRVPFAGQDITSTGPIDLPPSLKIHGNLINYLGQAGTKMDKNAAPTSTLPGFGSRNNGTLQQQQQQQQQRSGKITDTALTHFGYKTNLAQKGETLLFLKKKTTLVVRFNF